MALSSKLRRLLVIALGDKVEGANLADAIDSGANDQAAAVAALGVTTDLTGVDGSGNNAADLVTTEARLDDIEAKVDELIAALKAAGIMAS